MACVIDKGFTADRETALLDTDPGVLSCREPIEARFELVGKRAKLPFTHKFILVIPVVGVPQLDVDRGLGDAEAQGGAQEMGA